MPLFRRADGVPVEGLSAERRIMPHLMRGRNESAIYHEALYDISRTRRWLREYNRAGDHGAATLFHLVVWGCAYSIHRHPSMNRFVAGRRIYQRNEVSLSFAAKKTMERDAPLVTVKVKFPDPDESLTSAVKRITSQIQEGRTSEGRPVDKEMRIAAWLPVFLLSFVMWFIRLLDRFNLLPRRAIDNDPMFTSMFLANLGSLGFDNTYHHLYEYGTASLFAALGTQKKTVFMSRAGQQEVKDGLQIRFTLDERVADAFMAGDGLKLFRTIIEDPERFLGSPEEAARGAPPADRKAA